MNVSSHLVKLCDGGQVEEDAVVLDLDGERQKLHVLVLHVVQALTAENCGQGERGQNV